MISRERKSKDQALPEMIPGVMRSSVPVAVEDPSWEYCGCVLLGGGLIK